MKPEARGIQKRSQLNLFKEVSVAQQVYVTVAVVESHSRPGVSYTVKRSGLTGTLSCNCPAWIFQSAAAVDRKPCKHIKQLAAENGHSNI